MGPRREIPTSACPLDVGPRVILRSANPLDFRPHRKKKTWIAGRADAGPHTRTHTMKHMYVCIMLSLSHVCMHHAQYASQSVLQKPRSRTRFSTSGLAFAVALQTLRWRPSQQDRQTLWLASPQVESRARHCSGSHVGQISSSHPMQRRR